MHFILTVTAFDKFFFHNKTGRTWFHDKKKQTPERFAQHIIVVFGRCKNLYSVDRYINRNTSTRDVNVCNL